MKREHRDSILVVNDTPDQLDIVSIVLDKAGYSVFTATDGREGFEIAQRERPCLVISDVAMPRADGIALCRMIRADAELRSTPILLVSALRKDTASIVEGLQAGADDYLEAPYDPVRLVAKVTRLIERARLEAHYRELVEQASDIIYTHDLRGRMTSINAAGTRFFGRSQEQLIGLHFAEALQLGEGETKMKAAIDDLRHTGIGREQAGVRDGRGRQRWLEFSLALIRNREGEAVGVRGIARDITERWQAEEEQKRLQAAVRKSAVEWRLTFDAIEFPVMILDIFGRVTQLNRAAKELSLISYEKIAGRCVRDIGSGQPWQKASELVEVVRESRSAASDQARDGSNGRVWDVAANLILGPEVDTERIIIMARDITRNLELELSVRRSETMSAMGSLVAGVAHEVRNPLFGISSILDAFETRFGDRKEYQQYLRVLRGELNRLNELMRELLEYGKPQTSEFYLGSIEDVIAQAVRSCKPLMEKSNVQIINHIEKGLPQLWMDRRRMSQVFLNLLENAIHHSPPGGIVTLEAQEVREDSQDWIECTVKDSGPGFQAEDLPRIFEPFFTRRRRGSGLGLSIVQRIVEEHRGKIVAANRPDGGAVITVRFPLQRKEN